MLSKIATAGQNGQFRTPRHIIRALMVAMTAPTPKDEICDPACGTAGFLITAGEYLRRTFPDVEVNADTREHFHNSMFHGFDFDGTMLRIGSMNMLLTRVEEPDIRYQDSLSSEGAWDGRGGLYRWCSPTRLSRAALTATEPTAEPDLLRVVKTKKTELLFLALFLRLLKPGGRAAVIVARRRAVRLEQGAQGAAPHPGRGPEARRDCQAPKTVACSSLTPACRRRSWCSTKSGRDQPRLVLRRGRRRLEPRRQAHAASGREQLGCDPKEALTPEEHARNNLPGRLLRSLGPT